MSATATNSERLYLCTREPTAPLSTATAKIGTVAAEGSLVQVPSVPLYREGQGDEQIARHLEACWGADQHQSFVCPVPGHTGSARLIDIDGHIRLGCCRGHWRSLGEVVALAAYHEDRTLSNIQIATWTRRLAFDAGACGRVPSGVPSLPEDAPSSVRAARNGFDLLIGLRWGDHEPRAVAYSVRFAAAWCELSFGAAASALRELRRLRIIREADRAGRIALYMPGDGGASCRCDTPLPAPDEHGELRCTRCGHAASGWSR